MTRDKATKIVDLFFKDMNPTMWNGIGDKPCNFDDSPWQCELTKDVNLEITFVHDAVDGWGHYCDLVHPQGNSSFDVLSGYGIDSKLNLIDTVMDICRDYE